MTTRTIKSLLVAGLMVSAASNLFAYWTPLQINLAGDAGLPPAAESVYGVRVNVYGSCDTVSFLDAGLFNRTKKGSYGITAGAFNWSEQTFGGLAAGAVNFANDGYGVQVGVFNIAEKFTGLQIGLLNFNFDSVIPIFPIFNMGSGSGNK